LKPSPPSLRLLTLVLQEFLDLVIVIALKIVSCM
jgi:hypothetical protein